MTHSHTHIYRPHMAQTAMQNVHLSTQGNAAALIWRTSQCSFVTPFTRAHCWDSRLKKILPQIVWTPPKVVWSTRRFFHGSYLAICSVMCESKKKGPGTKKNNQGPLICWKERILLNLLTCNMLRLHGAGLFHERLLTFKGEDGLSSHALRLFPCSISGVVVIVEVNYVFKVGSVSFVGQTILLSHGLDAIDHLDWEAGGGRRVWLFYDNPVSRESFRSRFSYWRRQMHQKLRSRHHFKRPHHPRIVANVNRESAHLLLRFLAPGAFL